MINPRLFDHYGININKNLKIKSRCARPFDTVLIDKQGSCYACECTAWLPQSIGNLQISPLRDIIGSATHRHLQESITDGSYRYCNNQQCAYIKAGRFYEASEQQIRYLRLAIDNSCNLRCPSCRTQKIFHSRGPELKRMKLLADRVLEYLSESDHGLHVHIGSDGDPFASLVYRYFMRNVPKQMKHTYSLMTNALLLKKQYAHNETVFDNLTELQISIDGATKQTYEKLRLGGNWEQLKENLKFVSEIMTFDVCLHMVVQNDNWAEIPMMLDLADQYNFDRVYFNKIEDWNTGIDVSTHRFDRSVTFRKMIESVQDHPKFKSSIAV